jgi:hypothetical protein
MKQGGMFQIPGTTALFTFLRFLRLTPLYAFVLFFYAEILPHMGSGTVPHFCCKPCWLEV